MKRYILISASLLMASGAFAQSRCVNAPVSLAGSQVTLTSSGDKMVTKDQLYVYYSTRHHRRRHHDDEVVAGISERYHSTPILLNWDKKIKAVPEVYNVSLSTTQGNVSVCPDSTLNLVANINVEKVSSFTGNYPGTTDNKVYKRVSKHQYKMVARKMRKIRKNEERIARRSGQAVDIRTDRNKA